VKRLMVMALSVVIALVMAAPMALGHVEQSTATAVQAGQLAAAQWQWALEKPAAKNPLLGEYSGGPKCDGNSVSNSVGKTWFLSGTLDGSAVKRTCTAPANTQLFFPVLDVVIIKSEPNETEDQLRQQANDYMEKVLADPNLSTFATVDGKNVQIRRIESPLFGFTVPNNGLLSPGGYEGVADGLWVLLRSLSPGKHTIHFGGSAPNAPNGGLKQDNTYVLTVK
jgi:hypothetical protein